MEATFTTDGMFFILQDFDGDVTRNGAGVPTFDPC